MTFAVRAPTLLDVRAITGAALRIHPDDLRELREAYANCWPGNAQREVWEGTSLIVDIEAQLLPRKRL